MFTPLKLQSSISSILSTSFKMKTLAWMQRKFMQNNDEKGRNVSARKSYSCFSSLWELDEQQHYPEAISNYAHFRQPKVCPLPSIADEAQELEVVNDEKTVEMNHEFFHRFLAIGTLGSISIAKETVTTEAGITKEGTSAAGNEMLCSNKMLEKKLIEKEIHDEENESSKGMDSKENKNMVSYQPEEYSQMPAIKEEAEEHKTMPDNLFKKYAMSSKKTGKLDKGEKKGTHALHFMKEMLKKLDFKSQSSLTSAVGDAISGYSTHKKPTKEFRKSRKIHPDTAHLQVTKLNYEVKKMCYDNKVTLEEEDMYPQDGILKKETFNMQPTEKKAYWIKTDADYFVLEF